MRKNKALFLCGVLLFSPFQIPHAETVVPPTSDNSQNTGPTTPSRVLPGEKATHKNYWIPALEIPAFQFILNQVDRQLYPDGDYNSTFSSGWEHVTHGHWVVDQDDFSINQIGHPYQGSIYYGAARSCGLNFWESFLYANAGSYLWETYGETSPPSINDQVASGTGGSFLGESLFRMSNFVLESAGPNPGVMNQLAAGLISPPTMINRLIFGDKYGPVLESRHPAVFVQTQLGVGRNNFIQEEGSARPAADTVGIADLSMEYGLPGKPGYRYLRPFDYFRFDVSLVGDKERVYDNLSTRGLLFGTRYALGESYRGVWGLYGHFNYISPQIFRFSTTAASFGTTGQWWVSRSVALQGTVLGGLGYGSAGTITPHDSQGDFHYGATPQGHLDLRLLIGQRVALSTSGHLYQITEHGASQAPGKERIQQLTTALMVRLVGCQAIGLNYDFARREADYESLPTQRQRIGTVSVTYNILSDMNLGAVEWDRP